MLRYVLEPGSKQLPGLDASAPQDAEEVLEGLRATTVGAEQAVQTPFGVRRIVYVDYTASGRASTIVEDFVQKKVLPYYGNTHTLTTATARQTTYLRAEAREVIRHHLNALHEDAVIFAGNGSTGAAHLFVQTLQRAEFAVSVGVCGRCSVGEERRDMYYREDRWGGGECTLCNVRVKSPNIYQAHKHSETHRNRLRAAEEGGTGGHSGLQSTGRRRVVVLVDSLLHHSSSLPFRELLPRHGLTGGAALADFSGSSWRAADPERLQAGGVRLEVELSTVPVDADTGLLDEQQLQQRLQALRTWNGEGCELVVLCMLAAGSNVTGLVADVPRITAAAHNALSSALVCWDFAAAAGHVPCDLNPAGDEAAAVDVAFFSPHKLWGGPGSVGLLAMKKKLLCNAVPAVPGGGVVFFVSDEGHSYIQNSEEREEAGTPNILGCIRAGLAHHLLGKVPAAAVQKREEAMLAKVLAAWGKDPRIEVLGPGAASLIEGGMRTGVISFMIRYGNDDPGLYLHYNFVAAVLNDLFGLQARGGCACAGPYAQWLLGVGPELAVDFETCLKQTAQEVLRPGFVRVGVHWAMSEEDVEVLAAAVLWVAEQGWRLLPAYTFDRETGEWLHRLDVPERRRIWLSSLKVTSNEAPSKDPGPIAQLESALGLAPGATAEAPLGKEALLAAADKALQDAYSSAGVALSSSKWPGLDPSFARLQWFALPADVVYTMKSPQPWKPQLADNQGVFLAVETQGDRPAHSVLNARATWRRPHAAKQAALEAASTPQEEEEANDSWVVLPEEEEEEEEKPAAPRFSKLSLRPSIPKPLRGLVGRAIADFGMIKEGDSVLVGLSGGKDSLTVLHILLALQRSAPIKFRLAAATVDPQTPEYNPSPLVPYLQAVGVEYHVLQKPIIDMAKSCLDPKRPSICAFCSRMKRGLLYSCMREKGYNVLVLGQHLDDFAESFLMSAVHNGLLRTMKANYWVQQEDVRVCRPLLYVRESMAATFAKENQLPVIADNCPACFAAPKERHKTKLLLSSLEFDYPQLFPTLLRTMRPLYAQDTAERSELLNFGGDEDDDSPQRSKGKGGEGDALGTLTAGGPKRIPVKAPRSATSSSKANKGARVLGTEEAEGTPSPTDVAPAGEAAENCTTCATFCALAYDEEESTPCTAERSPPTHEDHSGPSQAEGSRHVPSPSPVLAAFLAGTVVGLGGALFALTLARGVRR